MNRVPMNRRTPWRLTLCAGAAMTLLAVGCGGGGSSDAGSSVTPASADKAALFAEGSIDGFGSVIVGGIRFDDKSAGIVDDDDKAFSSGDLKLGMMVEIESSAVDRATSSAKALKIRFGASVVGPVESIDAANRRLVVLGQTVQVDDLTVFGETLSGGLAAIHVADVLAVHARLDIATGRSVATRIEARAAPAVYRVRGLVAQLDKTAKTLRIGDALISYASVAAASVPADLANGQRIRVLLQTGKVGGAWVATTLRGGVPHAAEDLARIGELHGFATAFDAAKLTFTIDGVPVDASAASFPHGMTGLAAGARVEVEGSLIAGVFKATRVEVGASERPKQFELHGAIGLLTATSTTFDLRGMSLVFDRATVTIKDCGGVLPALGRDVEVKATPSADGSKLIAVSIQCKS